MTKRGPRKVEPPGTPGGPCACLTGSSPPPSALRDGRQALLPTILFADADENYRAMARDALLEGRSPSDLRFVTDGQDLLDYLYRRGRHLDPIASPRPALIVLDLELPRLRGLDAVRAIKSIPTCAASRWWRSRATRSPRTSAPPTTPGSTPILAKPVTFLALVKLMKVFTAYWLEAAALPERSRVSRCPTPSCVLVVQADEAAHAPVRAALKAIERPRYEIHWVTTPRAALAALDEHPHDAFLVDRELGRATRPDVAPTSSPTRRTRP